jgi:hypothetical protein
MPSFKLSAALVATAIFSLNAQAQYSIDPNSVPLATRQNWCQAQISSCPLLCLQNQGADASTTTANDCDATTLTYDCVCGNGYTPNVANYSQTIPFFECQEYGNQCVNSCGSGDTACQSACRDDHPCGAQNPTRINATSTSSTISSTGVPAGATSGTAGVVFTGLGGGAVATATSASSGSSTSSASSDTKKSGSKAVVDVGRSYGLAIVLAGVFAGFALIM